VANYIAQAPTDDVDSSHPEVEKAISDVQERIDKLLSIGGTRSPDSFHRELGQIIWDYCGMSRTKEGLETALSKIPKLREEFWKNLRVLGDKDSLNVSLEKAGRVADFLELGELMCRDALMRAESCGGHFREESQTEEGEAKRDDDNFQFVGAWEYSGASQEPKLHKEALSFEYVKPSQRSYK
jgi:succinate dehydrogenase / fumarate reductase flavoprotein subunit